MEILHHYGIVVLSLVHQGPKLNTNITATQCRQLQSLPLYKSGLDSGSVHSDQN